MGDYLDQSQFDWSLWGAPGAEEPRNSQDLEAAFSISEIPNYQDNWQTCTRTPNAEGQLALYRRADHAASSVETSFILGEIFDERPVWMNDLNTGFFDGAGPSINDTQFAVDLGFSGASGAGNVTSSFSTGPTASGVCEDSETSNGFARDFSFVSGCRPIVAPSEQAPSPRVSELAKSNRLVCIWPGCTSQRTFKRKYELQRHTKKHMESRKYPCTALNCPRVFYRLDKFRDHIRNDHGLDDLFNCSVAECSTEALPLMLLLTHVGSHTETAETEQYQALEASCKYDRSRSKRPCPFEGCTKWLPLTRLQHHLLTHNHGDLMEQKDDIADAGYDVLNGHVICPICDTKVADHAKLAVHLELCHITTDGGHFKAWRTVSANTDNCITGSSWKNWHVYFVNGFDLVCPTCGFKLAVQKNSFYDITHHLDHLAPVDQIMIQRRQKILNLWPEFETHPVFDDVRLTCS